MKISFFRRRTFFLGKIQFGSEIQIFGDKNRLLYYWASEILSMYPQIFAIDFFILCNEISREFHRNDDFNLLSILQKNLFIGIAAVFSRHEQQ